MNITDPAAQPTPTDPNAGVDAVVTPRPELHVTPEAGVLGAPAGALVDGQRWHIFHQYRPTPDAAPRWAHQFSDGGAYQWEECTDVLAPAAGEAGVWAGSAIPAGAGAQLYFTAVDEQGATTLHAAHIPDLEATTVEVEEDPLATDASVRRLPVTVSGAQELGLRRFRSPCVLPAVGGDWRMLLCADDAHGDARLVLCSSSDGVDFRILGPIEFSGDTGIAPGARLVSPRLVRLRDEVTGELMDVFVTTIECEGHDISGYLVGQLADTVFHVSAGFRRMDHGHDFTRPRNTNVAGDSSFEQAVFFGLMNGAGRFDDPRKHTSLAASGWANCLTLPRHASLQDGIVYLTPAPGLRAAISASATVAGWTGIIDTTEGEVTVSISDPEGVELARIVHSGDRLVLDRSMGPRFADSAPAVAPLIAADSDTLTVIVDGPTCEVFADGGVVAMASRISGCAGRPRITVQATGGAVVLHGTDFRNQAIVS